MSNAVPTSGSDVPSPAAPPGSGVIDRLAAFRVTYVALFVFILLYVFTVKAVEHALDAHFHGVVAEAIQVDPGAGPVAEQIQQHLEEAVQKSPWVRIGGVRVNVIVLGADGMTLLYLGGHGPRTPAAANALGTSSEAARLLPASADVTVTVPHNSLVANAILVFYAALLVLGLFSYNRLVARREQAALEAALGEREAAAERAARIERELAVLRERARAAEHSATSEVGSELTKLRSERERLQRELERLSRREQELGERARSAEELDEERRALEELLDEATRDLGAKDEQIRSLQTRLQRAARAEAAAPRVSERESDRLARRFQTLYKNLEIDERAIRDLVALRDEAMKLKAEESLKRLNDDVESAAVRRKVGGLPPHLSVFELGFAGKGRIYYTSGRQRRFRVLAVGAKNTQKTDLEYLSRLPRER